MKKAITGKTDLFTVYPHLKWEWNTEKNINLDPNQLLPGSSKEAWWMCTNGHEYKTMINQRTTRGIGCPYCDGRRVLAGFNDLATTHADIAAEWDNEKNYPLTAQNVMKGSHKGKKYWWICPKGHSYDQQIDKRTRRGYDCPVCSGHKVLKGFNDLATVMPEIANEWHPTMNESLGISPDSVVCGNMTKVWWICPNGHEYEARIHDRTSGGTGCKICNKRRQSSFSEQAIYFYVKQLCPDACNRYKDIFDNGMELDIYIPSRKVGIEFDGKNWHFTPEQIEREKRKYQICLQNDIKLIRVKEDVNDSIDYMGVADYIYRINPVKSNKTEELQNVIQGIIDTLDPDSNMWTRKTLFHYHSDKVIVNIKRDKNIIREFLSSIDNSLAALRPDVIKYWDYEENGNLKPDMFTVSSNEILSWKCQECGNTWNKSINAMTRKGCRGCPVCGLVERGKAFTKNKAIERGSLASRRPDLAEEWDKSNEVSPYEIPLNYNKRVNWLCKKCSYVWSQTPNNRVHMGSGCPHCSGRVPMPGVDDFKTRNPELMLEWDYERNKGLDPSKLLPHSGKKAWWKCQKCGHSWEATLNRRSSGHGCGKCSIAARYGKTL